MRRTLSIAAALLVLTQALAAGVPMLHQPATSPAVHAHGKHDCCPKPVVEVRSCCPRTISCPHQQHSAAACCCAESGETGIPTRKTAANAAALTTASALTPAQVFDSSSPIAAADPPLDNSPPILVLRN